MNCGQGKPYAKITMKRREYKDGGYVYSDKNDEETVVKMKDLAKLEESERKVMKDGGPIEMPVQEKSKYAGGSFVKAKYDE